MSKILNNTLIRNGMHRPDVLIRRYAMAATAEAFQAAKPLEDIPGYRCLPFIGTSWIFYPIVGKFKHTQAHLYDWDRYVKFGPISRDRFSGMEFISITDVKDIETMLRNDSKYPSRGQIVSLDTYRELRKDWYQTKGVLMTEGKEWYDLRFKLQRHLMKPRTIDRYIDPVTEVSRDLIKRLTQVRDHNNEVGDTLHELFKWSLESVAYVGLETRIGCLDPDTGSAGQKVIKSVQMMFDCMNQMEAFTGSSIQLWKHFPTPLWRKFVKSADSFSEFAFQQVQAALNKPTDPEHPTLIQAMLASKDIKPYEAMTMVMDMLMAGVDTTSNTVGILLYHLAKNPEKQEKLRQEILTLLPNPTDNLTSEKLQNMRYLKLCLKESMRLHPIVRGFARRVDKDMIFSGYHIPKDTTVFAILPALARSEKHYKDANSFIPERWDDRAHKPSPYIFIPFGFGTRSCIGRRIAELEMWILTSEILRKFKLEYHHEEFQMHNRMITVPDRPLKFTFIDRQ